MLISKAFFLCLRWQLDNCAFRSEYISTLDYPISFIAYNRKQIKMSTFFDNVQQTSLPANFAQSVLQLQMQMEFEQSSSLAVVQQLNELYTIAIEHYINCQDQRKMHHFQKKLQLLLTHPHTLEAIQNKTETRRDSKTRYAAQYNHHLKNQINKFNSESNVLVKSMVQGSEFKLERSNRLLNQNIESQEEKLRKRLASRSKSRSDTRRLR